jgi:hypothetical protein
METKLQLVPILIKDLMVRTLVTFVYTNGKKTLGKYAVLISMAKLKVINLELLLRYLQTVV